MSDIIKTAIAAAFKTAYPFVAQQIDDNLPEASNPIEKARQIAAVHARNTDKTPDQKAAMVKYAEVYAEIKLAERTK